MSSKKETSSTKEATNHNVTEKYGKDTYVTFVSRWLPKSMNNLKLNPGLNIFEGDLDRTNPDVGFIYTTVEKCDFFYSNEMEAIAVVEIPDDAKTVKHKIIGLDIYSWTTNKIVLLEKYFLFDVETIEKLGLKITNDYINHFTRYSVDYEYAYRISGNNLTVNHQAVVKLLNFCKKSGVPLENYMSYTLMMIDYVCKSQNIYVFEWMKTNGFFTKETERSLELLRCASKYRAAKVLTLWEEEIYPTMIPSDQLHHRLLYHTQTIKTDYPYTSRDVLQWWERFENKLKRGIKA
jgi:hypothetical protein